MVNHAAVGNLWECTQHGRDVLDAAFRETGRRQRSNVISSRFLIDDHESYKDGGLTKRVVLPHRFGSGQCPDNGVKGFVHHVTFRRMRAKDTSWSWKPNVSVVTESSESMDENFHAGIKHRK